MASRKHFNILKKSVEEWNKWRKENPEIRPSLSGASLGKRSLSQANLSQANLKKANLSEADLSEANLSEANLTGADLRKTILNKANLSEANLTRANLSESYFSFAFLNKADLRKANLMRASLEDAHLVGADLTGADLRRATLLRAHIAGADLRGADLRGTDLSYAFIREANLTGADLRGAILTNTILSSADLYLADLRKAKLWGANLYLTDLREANLRETDFFKADLTGADLRGAKLFRVSLRGADLSRADLSETKLHNANLESSILVETNFTKTKLVNCSVYGSSAWNIKQDKNTEQADLVITRINESTITVDNLEVAQFVYLMLNNKRICDVLYAITSKAVLILGNFREERIKVLHAIKEELRKRDCLPISFDFERPTYRDLEETVMILAGMSKFIIADITEPRSTPYETKLIVPDFAIPFLPIVQEGKNPFAMFDGLHKKYLWAAKAISYKDLDELLSNFDAIIKQSEDKLMELRKMKLKEPDSLIPIRLLNQKNNDTESKLKS